MKTHQINSEKLRDMEIRKKYEYATEEQLKAAEEVEDEQEQWNRMVRACQEVSEEVLGYIERKKRKRISDDEDIRNLSEEQKEMRLKINAAKEGREGMKERNENLRELHNKIKKMEEEKLIKDIEDIENSKDDSNRMYKAVCIINRNKSKEPILVRGQKRINIK